MNYEPEHMKQNVLERVNDILHSPLQMDSNKNQYSQDIQHKMAESYHHFQPLLFEIQVLGERECISGIVTGFDPADSKIRLYTELGPYKFESITFKK